MQGKPIRHNAIAVCDGRVYLIDRSREIVDLPGKGKGKDNANPAAEQPTVSRLVCLNAETGELLWEQSIDIYGTTLAVSSKHNILLMGYQHSQRSYQLPSEKGDRLTGFRTTDGKRLWDTTECYISRPIINGSTIYAQPYSFDLQRWDTRI
ncbi:MAG: hypothetical protein ACYSWW_08260 [Planctomycetota bacterium]|jgi:outer membrane protein assembly factor BamB